MSIIYPPSVNHLLQKYCKTIKKIALVLQNFRDFSIPFQKWEHLVQDNNSYLVHFAQKNNCVTFWPPMKKAVTRCGTMNSDSFAKLWYMLFCKVCYTHIMTMLKAGTVKPTPLHSPCKAFPFTLYYAPHNTMHHTIYHHSIYHLLIYHPSIHRLSIYQLSIYHLSIYHHSTY